MQYLAACFLIFLSSLRFFGRISALGTGLGGSSRFRPLGSRRPLRIGVPQGDAHLVVCLEGGPKISKGMI
ncbi:hypothetical protein F2Q69_00006528 [Brassica cretica]|uniref:Secreted protein n=1 Tax=Brassica cretica TaxID=69181 RepID=A0A8S9P197_BRACR|nr:hypothetical protein F2Q69_00006528 [Brassica cretica]